MSSSTIHPIALDELPAAIREIEARAREGATSDRSGWYLRLAPGWHGDGEAADPTIGYVETREAAEALSSERIYAVEIASGATLREVEHWEDQRAEMDAERRETARRCDAWHLRDSDVPPYLRLQERCPYCGEVR